MAYALVRFCHDHYQSLEHIGTEIGAFAERSDRDRSGACLND